MELDDARVRSEGSAVSVRLAGRELPPALADSPGSRSADELESDKYRVFQGVFPKLDWLLTVPPATLQSKFGGSQSYQKGRRMFGSKKIN